MKMSNNNTSKIEGNRGQFQKGKEKTGGRQKGTPNKKTKELIEILGSFNPAEKLIEIYNKTKDMELRANICKDLMKYVYPQRKAVEMDMGSSGFMVTINNKAVDVERDNI